MTVETGFAVVIREDDVRLHRHGDREGAEREAKRLAEINGGKFYVLSVVSVAREAKRPIEVVPVVTEDIPF